LGERLNGIQEVSGSIPLISTIKAALSINYIPLNGERVFCFKRRNQLEAATDTAGFASMDNGGAAVIPTPDLRNLK